MKQQTLFDDERLSMERSIELSAESLRHYGALYRHWAIAFSGGKDSSATVTLVTDLIEKGDIPRPESVTVLYADTRQELPPLHNAAMALMENLRERGFDTRIVCAPIEKRFWPYILGHGVPSPNNGTLRWCTRQIKVDPMTTALAELRREIGPSGQLLMLTGVRQGESAIRDQRIAVSCTKDGGECGQGWFQQMTVSPTEDMCGVDTLAPLLHWRVCHVWDWLVQADVELGYSTMAVAEAYSMTESIETGEEPLATRTGCIGCPLVATQDTALAAVCKQPQWAYLSPLLEIRALHTRLRDRRNRLRQPGGETKKDGTLVKNQGRFGPVKLEVRLEVLEEVLAIQQRVNTAALSQGRPQISLINTDEELFIRAAIGNRQFPQRWSGNEPGGEILQPEYYADGSIQPLLFAELD